MGLKIIVKFCSAPMQAKNPAAVALCDVLHGVAELNMSLARGQSNRFNGHDSHFINNNQGVG